jgi:hypothetical protein
LQICEFGESSTGEKSITGGPQINRFVKIRQASYYFHVYGHLGYYRELFLSEARKSGSVPVLHLKPIPLARDCPDNTLGGGNISAGVSSPENRADANRSRAERRGQLRDHDLT